MILAERAARMAAEAGLAEARAEAVCAKADLTGTEALIAHLKLAIEKLRRALYGSRSERQAKLLDQTTPGQKQHGRSAALGFRLKYD